MKSLQVLARVLGRGLTIDPVPHSSTVKYPFLAYHQYENLREEKRQKLNKHQKVLKVVHWNIFQNDKRVLPTILAPFSEIGSIGVMACLTLVLCLPKIWAC